MPPCPKCKGQLCKIRRVVGPEDAQVHGALCLDCGYSETWSYGDIMKKDYTKLDELICNHIKSGQGHPQYIPLVIAEAEAVSCAIPWRVVDRRLQKMRQKGKVTYANGAWWVK